MKKLLEISYRKDYLQGHNEGMDPYTAVRKGSSAAFVSGFNVGRLKYEAMNGFVNLGIPSQIVTDKILEDFLMAGMLGYSIDTDDYSDYQIEVISKWYQSGIEQYDPSQSQRLIRLLNRKGIEIK